jgi:hypothetical protein
LKAIRETLWLLIVIKGNKSYKGGEKLNVACDVNRTEYVILKVLKKQQCTSRFQSMTLKEIMNITQMPRVTIYRKMLHLCEYGLVGKGCQCGKADTYFILENGLNIVESEEGRTKL